MITNMLGFKLHNVKFVILKQTTKRLYKDIPINFIKPNKKLFDLITKWSLITKILSNLRDIVLDEMFYED